MLIHASNKYIGETTYANIYQINVLDTLGLISASVGDWQGTPGGEHVELTDKASGRHLSLCFHDDVMVGCNAVGWTDHIGVMRGLVEGQIKLGAWKDKLMQDPTRLVEAYQASALGQDDWSVRSKGGADKFAAQVGAAAAAKHGCCST